MKDLLTHAIRLSKPSRSIARLALLCALPALPKLHAESFCLDFRWQPDTANLLRFDFSILDLQSQPDLGAVHGAGKKSFCYISAGQIAGNAPYLDDVVSRGIRMVSYNGEWNSYYPDLSDPRWADYFVNVLAPIAVNKGFDGFFLDTVDAVETLMDLEPSRAALHYAGMVNLILSLKAAYPSKKIILNRGFAVFSSVSSVVKGVVVEELFQRDDYTARSSSGVDQLLARIAPITAAGLPVYIVDYVPSWDLPLAEATAERIANLGFHPAVISFPIDGTVLAPNRPQILSHPQDRNVRPGDGLTLTVAAAGSRPLRYRWRVNGREIAGANAESLSLPSVQSTDAGTYTVEVSNVAGTETSRPAIISVTAVDSDGDRMPDDWESQHQLDPFDSSDAGADADGDGASNLDEYQTGTDPRDAGDFFGLQIQRLDNGRVQLSFPGRASASYTVQYRTSMNASGWTKLADWGALQSDQIVSIIDPVMQSSRMRCYRVVTPAVP